MSNRSKKWVLSGKREFNAVFSGKKVRTPEALFYYTPNSLGIGRLGLVVKKSFFDQAVIRNKLRRRLRELFRLFAHRLNGIDIVIVVRKSQRVAEFGSLKRCFETLLTAANR
ncbi:MAG: ribonuclease P protein component [Nitrospinota bacterium]